MVRVSNLTERVVDKIINWKSGSIVEPLLTEVIVLQKSTQEWIQITIIVSIDNTIEGIKYVWLVSSKMWEIKIYSLLGWKSQDLPQFLLGYQKHDNFYGRSKGHSPLRLLALINCNQGEENV